MSDDQSIKDLDAGAAAEHYEKWKRLAPLGLVGVGLGVSLVGQSTILKAEDQSSWTWVLAGTVSLAVLNAGLCMFGDAVKHRALYEWTSGSPGR